MIVPLSKSEENLEGYVTHSCHYLVFVLWQAWVKGGIKCVSLGVKSEGVSMGNLILSGWPRQG